MGHGLVGDVSFLLKVVVVVVMLTLLHRYPITVYWQNYKVDTDLAVVMVVLGLGAWIVGAVVRLRGLPRGWSHRYRRYQERRGQRCLLQALEALMLGDDKAARSAASRAEALLQHPQSARVVSAWHAPGQHHRWMTDHRETSGLGYLLAGREAQQRGQKAQALTLAAKAWKEHPKAPATTEFYARQLIEDGATEQALKVLQALPDDNPAHHQTLRKVLPLALKGALQTHQWRSAEAALESCLTVCPDHPDMLASIQALIANPKSRRAAARALQTLWKRAPSLTIGNALLATKEGSKARIQTAQDLLDANPQCLTALQLVVEEAIHCQLWGTARAHLKPYADGGSVPTWAALAWARLESADHNPEGACAWLRRMGEPQEQASA